MDLSRAPPYDETYLVESDIDAFAEAIEASDNVKITAMSDWAPTDGHTVKKRKNTAPGIFYHVLRWPILVFIILWIGLLVICYSLVRIYVASYERFVVWQGKRKSLRQNLRAADTYEEWTDSAEALDKYLGNDAWKKEPMFEYYDYVSVKTYLDQLHQAESDPGALAPLLQDCVRYNFAGTQGPQLYSQTYYGTKDLVADFNAEVVKSIDLLAQDSGNSDLNRLTTVMSQNFGKSALCLSGGACFAYIHFGVVKTLLKANLLPNVISGTSGGGLVAALVCTRTNEELNQLLDPDVLAPKITACWEKFPYWFIRYLRTSARFDSIDWARRAQWFTMGSLTFKEAYERTGKVLNISTVPEDPHSPVILCNYVTSPDTVIWSALMASAAVPGILKPVTMMMKIYDDNSRGRTRASKTTDFEKRKYHLVPYRAGTKWKDGSLRTDIPIQALNTYFNVNFTIVSQVNPHVSLFIYAPRGTVGRPTSHRKGKGWRGGFVGSALENVFKLEIIKWLKLIKNMNLLPRLKDQDWSSVWLQRFDGTVTVWPKIHLGDFWHILDDPTPEKLAQMMLSGEKSMFPRLLFIRHFMSIEAALDRAQQVAHRRSDAEQISSNGRSGSMKRRAKSFVV